MNTIAILLIGLAIGLLIWLAIVIALFVAVQRRDHRAIHFCKYDD